jgi:hypothetical protein
MSGDRSARKFEALNDAFLRDEIVGYDTRRLMRIRKLTPQLWLASYIRRNQKVSVTETSVPDRNALPVATAAICAVLNQAVGYCPGLVRNAGKETSVEPSSARATRIRVTFPVAEQRRSWRRAERAIRLHRRPLRKSRRSRKSPPRRRRDRIPSQPEMKLSASRLRDRREARFRGLMALAEADRSPE